MLRTCRPLAGANAVWRHGRHELPSGHVRPESVIPPTSDMRLLGCNGSYGPRAAVTESPRQRIYLLS